MHGRNHNSRAGCRGWSPQIQKRRKPVGAFIAAAVCVTALAVLAWQTPVTKEERALYAVAAQPEATPVPAPTLPPCVIAGFAEGETGYTIALSETRLLAGRMMLVDEDHPVPAGFSPPACHPVLERTGGRVACRDLTAVLASDALEALDEMFRHARYARHNELVVFAASRSAEQQRYALMDRMCALSRSMSFEAALQKAKAEVGLPGCCEHQLPWCVDIRLCEGWNDLPSSAPLEESEAGRWLTENCWAYGFIRRYPGADTDTHRAWHFRYVGKAHAAMMHALGMELEEYLRLLREKGVLTLLDESGEAWVTVICRQAEAGETRFTLPLHGTVEDASYDNDGWAVVSCLYQ